MNRTLLLIICDFLLLNLLALTRWEQVEPVPPSPQQAKVEPIEDEKKEDEEKVDDDMVALLKAALEKESNSRADLERKLKFVEGNFASQEQALSQLKQNANSLQSRLQTNQAAYQELSKQYSMVSLSAAKNREEVNRLTGDLEDRQKEIQMKLRELAMEEANRKRAQMQASNLTSQVKVTEAEKRMLREQYEKRLAEAEAKRKAELDAKAAELAALEKAKQEELAKLSQAKAMVENQVTQLNGQVQGLSAQVQAGQKEKAILERNVTDLKGEVAVVRLEKRELQKHAEKLSAGVSQLAMKSKELTDEFRDSQAINPNQMFNTFLSNRVSVSISGISSGLFGSSERKKENQTLLVRDKSGVYALMHIKDSPLALARPAVGLEKVVSSVTKRRRDLAFRPLEFLMADPRLVVIPVNETLASITGVKVYDLTTDPFKFAKAVLIGKGGGYYGEAEFRLDPRNPEFVKMKGGFFKSLFGEFSPSSGDLVLSKSGELLGVMVNSDYCVVLRNLDRVPNSELTKTHRKIDTKRVLEALKSRLDKLPFSVQ